MKRKLWLAAAGLALLAGCGERAGLESPIPAESDFVVESPAGEIVPAPAPDRGDLTEEDVRRVNEAFQVFERDVLTVEGPIEEINGFFLSHYSDPRELNLEEFLRYFPDDGTLDDAPKEFAALAALPEIHWRAEDFGVEILTAETLLWPTHRYRRESVDAVLEKYAGITTRDLVDTGGLCYLPEYDCWYNFTSDYGPGSFACEGGRVTEDTAVLWTGEACNEGWREELTLEKKGERWYIRSFLRVPVDRGRSLEAFLLGLTGEEIQEVSDGWGLARLPEKEAVAELVRKAVQNPDYDWNYRDDEGEERDIWELRLALVGGRELDLAAGIRENIVKVEEGTAPPSYYRAPGLYRLLREMYDGDERNRTVDRAALEKYRPAAEEYLAEQAFAPEVRAELVNFYLLQENRDIDAQIWYMGADLTTDPPELAPRLVGNGYVDSRLRMHPITGGGADCLLVTMEGKVLSRRNWEWLEGQGLDRFDSREALENALWPIDSWEKEVLSDRPGDTRVRYFVTIPGGEKVIRLDTDRMTEERDPDRDGETELLAYRSGNKRAVGVYDIIGEELRFLEVNEALGAEWSDYMGNVGNAEWPYNTCFQAGYADRGIHVYRYGAEGTLTYICPLEDALRK